MTDVQFDPDIRYEGRAITLPAEPKPMSFEDAIEALLRKREDEQRVTDVLEIIEYHPMDAAVALNRAMKEIYGWASPVPTMGFFGPEPPQMISVKTGPGAKEVVQVPWGAFRLPNVEGTIATQTASHKGEYVLQIVGSVRKKDAFVVRDLADKAREILREASIYKGKAIRLRVNSGGKVDLSSAPDFMPADYLYPKDLILNDGEGIQVDVALWTPIKQTRLCRENRIPLKRGVLLSGPYGCGKTLTASVTATIAVENGWTFIYLDKVEALKDALQFAKRYAPAVVFAEDVERIASSRDDKGNDLLNTIDGILAKDAEVITVLTTNHVERLERAMLRPGRLDAVINIGAPQSSAVQRLIGLYARDLIDSGEDLAPVGAALAGQIPATIREVVERSKLSMIARQKDRITAQDLLNATEGMKMHLALLAPKDVEKSVEQRTGEHLKELLTPKGFSNGHSEEIFQASQTVKNIAAKIGAQIAG